MIQLNLIPDVKKEYLKSQRLKKTITMSSFIASGFFLAIVVILIGTVYLFQKSRINSLQSNIDSNISALQNINDLDKILTVQNQLNALPQLHDEEPKTSRLFNYLSKLTPNTVKLENLIVDFDPDAATIEVRGHAKSFKEVNKFVDAIKNATYVTVDDDQGRSEAKKAFFDVVLSQIDKDNDEDSNRSTIFAANFSYETDIFSDTFSKVTLSVPNITSSVSVNEKPAVFDTGGEGDE